MCASEKHAGTGQTGQRLGPAHRRTPFATLRPRRQMVCPLTGFIMEEPTLLLVCGHYFEREAVLHEIGLDPRCRLPWPPPPSIPSHRSAPPPPGLQTLANQVTDPTPIATPM